MPTLAEIETDLSDYAGANQSFLRRLNLVRARLIQGGNWPGTKDQILLTVYSDRDGSSIVTPPRQYKTILAGAVRTPNVLCAGLPLGVRNAWDEFSPNGAGYGGLTNNFQEVTGHFCVFQEWTDPMRLRFKFETSEAAGVIHIRGQLAGEKVYSLYSGAWIEGEKLAYSLTAAVTTTKYFDPDDLRLVKPITLGRVTMYTVDADGVETLVASYEPTETVPRWKRYKVPSCEDVTPVESTAPTTVAASQVYTKTELEAMFSGSGTFTVNEDVTHDLAYSAFFLRRLRVIAEDAASDYIANFLLDSSTAHDGAILRISLEVAASASPTLRFFDNTLATLRQEVFGDSSNAQYMTLVFAFDGTNWGYTGREQ